MRAVKTTIRGLTKPQFQRLKDLTGSAKDLYNQALWTLREAYDATGKYFSYPKMDKAMKQVKNLEGEVNYRLLKSAVSQATLRRLEKNFNSFFRVHQDFKRNPKKYQGRPRPPKFKQGKHDNLIYDCRAFQVKERLVVLKSDFEIKSFKIPSQKKEGKVLKSVEVLVREGYVVLEKGLEIKLPKQLVGKTIKQVEVVPKPKSFHAIFVYDDSVYEIYQQVENPNRKTAKTDSEKDEPFDGEVHDKIMSIDLGLNNLATGVTNGVVKPFIIDGRRLKSVNAYYKLLQAKMQSQLEKQRGRKWSHKLQNITNRRNAAVNDYIHRATHVVVKTCLENHISKVVVGDVTKSLNCLKLGKKTNQNFINLSLGQFVDKLSYKLGSHGIKLEVTNESYSSKASFVDGDKMPKTYNPKAQKKPKFSGLRVKRGLYESSDGTLLNADANGAYNILRKNEPEFSFEKLVEKVGTKFKDWLHPTKRIRFFLKKKRRPSKSNPKFPLDEGMLG